MATKAAAVSYKSTVSSRTALTVVHEEDPGCDCAVVALILGAVGGLLVVFGLVITVVHYAYDVHNEFRSLAELNGYKSDIIGPVMIGTGVFCWFVTTFMITVCGVCRRRDYPLTSRSSSDAGRPRLRYYNDIPI